LLLVGEALLRELESKRGTVQQDADIADEIAQQAKMELDAAMSIQKGTKTTDTRSAHAVRGLPAHQLPDALEGRAEGPRAVEHDIGSW
jgi:hypothetical protein